MRNLRLTILPALAMAATSFAPAHAATVNVEVDLTPTYTSTHGVGSSTSTSTVDLVGSQITATYTDGTTENWVWTQRGTYNAGTDHVSDDLTIDYHWSGFMMNATKRVASFAWDMFDADVIWDAGNYRDPDPRNSPTTLRGVAFKIGAGNDALVGDVVATYSDHVEIAGYAAGEDAFTNLFVDFTGLEGGGLLGGITWNADTDALAYAGDLTPVVPLPAGGLLLLTGFAGFGLMRRRRKG